MLTCYSEYGGPHKEANNLRHMRQKQRLSWDEEKEVGMVHLE